MDEFGKIMRDAGATDEKRAEQAASWMWDEVTATLIERVRQKSDVADTLEADVRAGKITPTDAALKLIDRFNT